VQANSPTALVVLTQMQPMTVILSIAQDHLPQLQSEQSRGRRLRVDALDRAQSNTIATGELIAIDNQIDTATGTVRLRAQFDNKKNELFPNQFVNTRVLVRTQHDGTKAFVYVVSGDTAHIRALSPGVADAGVTAVAGLEPGDVLANSSFERLRDNARVEVTR